MFFRAWPNLPPPSNSNRVETRAVNEILRCPTYSMCRRTVCFLRKHVRVKILSVWAYFGAIRIRCASKALDDVQSWFEHIQKKTHAALPISVWLQNEFSPPGWGSPAIVCNLTNAIHCVGLDEDLKCKITSIIHDPSNRHKMQAVLYQCLPDSLDCNCSPLLREVQMYQNWPSSANHRCFSVYRTFLTIAEI